MYRVPPSVWNAIAKTQELKMLTPLVPATSINV